MTSVIIPNWNGESFLKTCLDSLQKQTFQDFEIILVDNGSFDESLSFVKTNYPQVRTLEFKENRGFSRAVNAGIKISNGETIALLNNDTEVDPRWLEELNKVLNENPEVGFCGSKIHFYDRRKIINSTGITVGVNGSAWDIGYNSMDSGQFNDPKYIFSACAAASIYRKNLFQDVGLFDEDFFAYAEDVDLSFRAQLRGFKCLYVPSAIVYHRCRATTLQNRDLPDFYIERNLIFNLIKNMPFSIFLRFPLKILRYQLYRFVDFLIHGRLLIWLKSRLSVLPYLKIMLLKRWKIQKRRRVSLRYIEANLDKGRFRWF